MELKLKRSPVAALIAVSLLASGCGPLTPLYGGGFHDTAEEAIESALMPGGGLGDFDEVHILQTVEAPDSRVAVYAGNESGDWAVGLADAKHSWRGWWAHGMFGLPALPQIDGGLTCSATILPSGGGRWLIITGRLASDDMSTVQAAFADGVHLDAATRPGIFALITKERDDLLTLRGLDDAGHLVTELGADECSR
jgi:hypothetical protein